METNTRQYEAAHGKLPKGTGMWALKLIGTDGNGSYTNVTYYIHGKLNEAKKEAVSRMKSEISRVKKVVSVTVLS